MSDFTANISNDATNRGKKQKKRDVYRTIKALNKTTGKNQGAIGTVPKLDVNKPNKPYHETTKRMLAKGKTPTDLATLNPTWSTTKSSGIALIFSSNTGWVLRGLSVAKGIPGV